MGDQQSLQILELEKTIRILRRKLERSEKDREQLESDISAKEALLKNVIRELQTSKDTLEQKSQDLQKALEKMQKMQAQLVQSEKMSVLGQITAGVAHEINNPIGFIYSNLEFLDEYVQDLFKVIHLYRHYSLSLPTEFFLESEEIDIALMEEDIPKILQSMNRGTQRIRDIVLALRSFSRLHEVGYKEINVHRSIDSILLLLQQNIAGIQIIRNYDKLPPVICSAGDLNQALINILNNAVEAIVLKAKQQKQKPADIGKISITTQCQSSQQVMISIKDNGIGIDPKVIDKIFDPFFTTQDVGDATGLGLTIAHQIIVEMHHGSLKVVSDVGQGTECLIGLSLYAA